MSSDMKRGKRPASFLAPTKFRFSSIVDSGNPVRTSRSGKIVKPRGRLTLLQNKYRLGASHGSGPRASDRITGFSMFPKDVLKSLRLPIADERVYEPTI